MKSFKKPHVVRKACQRSTWRPRLEILEDRITPTTYTVNTLIDGAPAVDGLLTLREAVQAAVNNAAVGDAAAGASATQDVIRFDSSLAGAAIRLAQGVLGQRDQLLIDGGGDLSIIGPDAGIILQAGVQDRIFNVTSTAGAISLNNLTLTGGNVVPEGASGLGGAILNTGNLSLNNVTVTNNFSNGGGGIGNFGASALLTVNNSVISQNTALSTSIGGGGILSFVAGAQLFISNSIISDNVTLAEGGGISNGNSCFLSIVGSAVVNNRAGTNKDGGGIRNVGTLSIRSSSISNNIAPRHGGGISNEGSQLNIVNSTLALNVAGGGGGAVAQINALGFFTPFLALVNTTVAHNTAASPGGGLLVTSGALSILNGTITNNVGGGDSGGIGFTSGSQFVMANTIVAQNFVLGGSSAPDVRGNPSGASINNFIGIGDAALTGITDFTNGNRIGTAANPLDPRLGPLTDNGNADATSVAILLTRMPLPGSPVIDAADSAELATVGASVDEIGGKRFMDGNADGAINSDIGAVEFVPATRPVVVAPAKGRAPEVRVFQDGQLLYSFFPYAKTFKGGVRVAVGDVTGDGVPDIVTAPGAGIVTEIRVFDGRTRAQINSFKPYGATFKRGAFLTVGNVIGGNPAEIVIAPEKGAARVLVSDRFGTIASSFFPFGQKHAGGVRIATGDVAGNSDVDIVALNRSSGQVGIFSTAGAQLGLFTVTGGKDGSLAVGNLDGQGRAEILVGQVKGGADVQILNGSGTSTFGPPVKPFGTFTGGIDVAAADLDGDGIAELIAGRRSKPSQVRVLDLLFAQTLADFTAFEATFSGGVLVAG